MLCKGVSLLVRLELDCGLTAWCSLAHRNVILSVCVCVQIIGIGLCGVFELIKETRFSHPSLCLRSLQALLDMLQGQQPEGFQTEPPDVLGKAEKTHVCGLNKSKCVD